MTESIIITYQKRKRQRKALTVKERVKMNKRRDAMAVAVS